MKVKLHKNENNNDLYDILPTEINLPEGFYFPQKKDFCKYSLMKGNKRCTMGHIMNIFKTSATNQLVISAWHVAATEVGIYEGGKGVTGRNDHRTTTFKQLENAFKLMCIKLGYTITIEEVD